MNCSLDKKKISFREPFLTCIYTNASSLNNKLTELVVRLEKLDRPHIVCVSETWYSEYSIPCISGYTLYRRDRTGRGGGVCIYVRDDLCSMEVKCSVLCADGVEQIWCGVRSGGESLLVGCMYRPPKSNGFVTVCVNDSLKEARKMIEDKIYDAVVVCGDFNFPEINWTCDGGNAS